MKTLGKLGLLCGLIGILAIAAPAGAADKFGDEWKIIVSGSAASAGKIKMTLTFEPGSGGASRNAVYIDTPVPANSSEDDIVGLLGDSFSNTLSDEEFDVDITWGEHIAVKAEGNTPEFALTVTSNTLQGVSVDIRE